MQYITPQQPPAQPLLEDDTTGPMLFVMSHHISVCLSLYLSVCLYVCLPACLPVGCVKMFSLSGKDSSVADMDILPRSSTAEVLHFVSLIPFVDDWPIFQNRDGSVWEGTNLPEFSSTHAMCSLTLCSLVLRAPTHHILGCCAGSPSNPTIFGCRRGIFLACARATGRSVAVLLGAW